MGFTYLDGKRWAHVTREERFFCQRLYELIKSEGAENFARYLSRSLHLEFPFEGEWEVAYEVCFYRDLWHQRHRQGKPISPKRTFDLCLFGESAILIIEAKAAVGFGHNQNEFFRNDVANVRELTRVDNVHLVGLCSSRVVIDHDIESTFGTRVIRWKDLGARYGSDETLKRADDIYEEGEPFGGWGRHSDLKMSGAALLDVFRGGARWWVGRGAGGISGERFNDDVRTGRWKTQLYEVNTRADQAPSPNYFELAEFVGAVTGGESARGASD